MSVNLGNSRKEKGEGKREKGEGKQEKGEGGRERERVIYITKNQNHIINETIHTFLLVIDRFNREDQV